MKKLPITTFLLSLIFTNITACNSAIGIINTNDEIVPLSENAESLQSKTDNLIEDEEATTDEQPQIRVLCGTAPFSVTQDGLTVKVWSSWVSCNDPNNYIFEYGDGDSSAPTPALTETNHTYAKAGTYKINVIQVTPKGEKIQFLQHDVTVNK
jgi:hypothetical protein